MRKRSSRLAQSGIAFVLTFTTVGLVWYNGWLSGRKQAIPITVAATADPSTNAFLSPTRTETPDAALLQQFADAIEQGNRAQTEAEKRAAAEKLCQIGRTAHFQSRGNGQISHDAYQNALRLYRSVGDQEQEAGVLADLSDTQRLLGMPDEAEKSLRRSIVLLTGNTKRAELLADVHSRLGDLLRVRGRYREAREILDTGLRLQQRLHHEPGIADALVALGETAFEEGSLGLARQLYNEAEGLFAKNGKTESRAAVLGQLGDVALAEGDIEEALRLYREGLSVWEARQQEFWIGRFEVRLAKVALAKGDPANANRLATSARQRLASSNGPVAQARALAVLADIALRTGKREEAQSLLNQAVEFYRAAGYTYGLAECQAISRQ